MGANITARGGFKVKLQGKLTITRRQPAEEYVMHMDFMDEASRIHFLQVSINPHDLMLALTSFADQPCEFELGGAERVGKVHENRNVFIANLEYDYRDKAGFLQSLAEALRPFEVDGWKADLPREHNHYDDTEKGYKVAMRRYVGEGLGYGSKEDAALGKLTRDLVMGVPEGLEYQKWLSTITKVYQELVAVVKPKEES
jgi:hypothetical protein